MKILVTLIVVLSMTGCDWLRPRTVYSPPEPITVITQQTPLQIYHPPLPMEVNMESVQWLVITEANIEEQFAKIRTQQGDGAVVFAVTPQGYENLSYNLQELRRYIRQMREIVVYYQSINPAE
jgi:hypothetical protein